MPPRTVRPVTYEIAVAEVTETFDVLELTTRAASTRDWVLESDAAQMLGVTKKALERRRVRATGPINHRRMGYVAYFLDDLDRWVDSKPKAYRPPLTPQNSGGEVAPTLEPKPLTPGRPLPGPSLD